VSDAAPKLPFFAGDRALLLYDRDYFDYLGVAIRRARQRIVAVQFVVDARPSADAGREVRSICRRLGEAAWRGTEVRVLLNRFLTGSPRLEVNGVAGRFLRRLGVGVRSYRAPPGSRREQIHSKYVVIDDRIVVVGSHNWTPGALGDNHEISMAVESKDLARSMLQTFNAAWENGVDDLV
jgi:phosphatidylserine/phosphatidylglycerophosphate/cardiolipin synthase-like enzyme